MRKNSVMNENDKICKVLIVDNNVNVAIKIAQELSELNPKLLENQSLKIEISNTAYFVAKHLGNTSDNKPPWDIILSDVYMPIPSTPLERNTANEDAELKELSHKDIKWNFWEYKYTWNSHAEGTPDHGGLYIAQKVKELKQRKENLKNLKVILISDKLIDPVAIREMFDFLQSEKSWFNYYDKTNWEEGTDDWPNRLNKPNIFRWAVIHAINERKEESWGDLIKNTFSKAMKEIGLICKNWGVNPKVDRILITGERGTGKSMLAIKLHDLRMGVSGAKGKFVTVECTGISDDLFASQLFGHKKGAFTGAIDDKVGFVETAKDGTLFFDEIGDLSPANQGKILRLLQDRQFVMVGDTKDKPMESKLVIFATNKKHDHLKDNNLFRSDLYDRIKSFPIEIPSLKSRKEEIIPLAEHFLETFDKHLKLTDDAKHFLQEQNWHGNVRELKDVIQNAATLCTSTELKVSDIQYAIPKNTKENKTDSKSVANDYKTVEITAENIVEGEIKWSRIKKVRSYDQRSAIMIAARSVWQNPQRELAELLDVNHNSLEQFFSTVKRKIRKSELDILKLKPHVNPNHHPALEFFFDEALKSKH